MADIYEIKKIRGGIFIFIFLFTSPRRNEEKMESDDATAEESLRATIAKQRKTVQDLRESRERLNALSLAIGAQDKSDTQALLRGVRIARQLQNDLNEIQRRLGVVKGTLDEVRRVEDSIAKNAA